MSLAQRIVRRVQREFFRWRYLYTARGILDTAPLKPGSLPFVVLSMVQKRDVISYLIALKSFCLHANPKRVVIVCDPSIDRDDRAMLSQHIPHVELLAATACADPQVPRGGTWERLLAISNLAVDNYVVQLDADTVTVGPIPEVLAAIQAGHGFVIGERAEQQIKSLADASAHVRDNFPTNTHIQSVSELTMGRLDRPSGTKYVRGCSGFTGFPPATGMRSALIRFSTDMQALIGERWSNWGTEQVSSNYLVANSTGAQVLPYPKYATPDAMDAGTVFLHFIGYTRFVNSKYQKKSRTIIESLKSAAV